MNKQSSHGALRPRGRVLFVGTLPPPVGGVTVANARILDELARLLPEHRVAHRDPRSAAIRELIESQALVVALSGPSQAWKLLPFALVRRAVRPTYLLVHAPDESLERRRSLRTFQVLNALGVRVLTTNAALLRGLGLGGREFASVVQLTRYLSPQEAVSKSGLRLITFCYEGSRIYGTAECISAFRAIQEEVADAELTLVLYGRNTEERRELARNVRNDEPDIRVLEDLSTEEVESELGRASVLLRLSSQDGDSQVVRQALAHGIKVVATSRAPRPAGVITVETTDSNEVAEAVLRRTPAPREEQPPVMTFAEQVSADVRVKCGAHRIIVATILDTTGPVVTATLGSQLQYLGLGADEVLTVSTSPVKPDWAEHLPVRSSGVVWIDAARVAIQTLMIARRLRPTIVYARDDWVAGLLAIMSFALPSSTRLHVDKRGLAIAEMDMNKRPWTRRAVVGALERVSLRRAAKTMFVSRELRDELGFGSASNAVVVPNCAPLPEDERGWEGPVLAVFVGGGDVWQCPAETLNLLLQMKKRGIEVFVATRDARFLDHALTSGLPAGQLSRTQVQALLRRATVSLVLRENHLATRVASPIKLAESLAAGCGVVATRASWEGIGELQNRGDAFILDSTQPNNTEVDALCEWVRSRHRNRDTVNPEHHPLISWEPYKSELQWFFAENESGKSSAH